MIIKGCINCDYFAVWQNDLCKCCFDLNEKEAFDIE